MLTRLPGESDPKLRNRFADISDRYETWKMYIDDWSINPISEFEMRPEIIRRGKLLLVKYPKDLCYTIYDLD